MESSRRTRTSRSAALAGALGLVLGLAACSSSSGDDDDAAPRPAVTLGAASPYEHAVLADRPTALWPLRDADGLRPRDQVAALGGSKRPAAVVGGTISGTSSPAGARGALFLRGGRIVTPVREGLTSADAFTVEVGLRADACTSAWGRVLGTTDLTEAGREGMEVLHFPAQFQQNPCRVAVEFWHAGSYLGGCHPSEVPAIGRWFHLAVVYRDQVVSCYRDGVLVERGRLSGPTFEQPGPLGIGGSGSGFQGPLDGMSLSEVALYDRALSATQVARHAALLSTPG